MSSEGSRANVKGNIIIKEEWFWQSSRYLISESGAFQLTLLPVLLDPQGFFTDPAGLAGTWT